MKVLLTGGFGYLGGRLGQSLHAAGMEVVLGSRSQAPAPEWLLGVGTVVTNWSSHQSLLSICKGMDAVIHLAGMNAQDCAADPALALQMNGVGTAQLVKASAEAGVRRFVYFSTAHVYASPLVGSISEVDRPLNLHPYATSHRAGEDAVRAAHQRGDIEGVVVRLSNGFGAPATLSANCWMLVANDLARQLVTTNRVVLKTNGQQKRDFIALSELNRIIEALLVLPTSRLDDGLFNVGGRYTASILDMATQIIERFRALYGRMATLEMPQGDAIGANCELDYTLRRLVRAGIDLPKFSSINTEIDALLRFCVNEFA